MGGKLARTDLLTIRGMVQRLERGGKEKKGEVAIKVVDAASLLGWFDTEIDRKTRISDDEDRLDETIARVGHALENLR